MVNLMDGKEKAGCVVTGVAGFVGSHLAECLLARGFDVVGVDNFFSGFRKNMDSFFHHPSFFFLEQSIAAPRLLSMLKRSHSNLKYCFHLAAIVSVPYSMEHPEETMAINGQASLDLLREADELGFERFVFAGSAAEYGQDERLPLREEYADEETRHLSPYGRAKYLASREVGSSRMGIALRCFNIYGPRQDPRSPYSGVVSRFLEMALAKRPLTVFGDGLQSRDFVYVLDVVDAYVRAAGLEGSACSPGIYNVGSGKGTTVLELANIVRALSHTGASLRFLPERAGDIRHSLAAPGAFRRATGWVPRVSIEDGIQATLRWAGDEPD